MTFTQPLTPYHLATFEWLTDFDPVFLAAIAASRNSWERKRLQIAKNKRHELTFRKGRRPVYTKPKGYSTKRPVRNTVRFNRK